MHDFGPTNVEIGYENLIAGEIITNDKTAGKRVHDPVQHSNSLSHNGPEVGIKMNRHHGLI